MHFPNGGVDNDQVKFTLRTRDTVLLSLLIRVT